MEPTESLPNSAQEANGFTSSPQDNEIVFEGFNNPNDSKEAKNLLSDEEILNTELAQNVLPYLTLDKLSDHEQAEILRFADTWKQHPDDGNTIFRLDGHNPNNGSTNEADKQNTDKTNEAYKLFCAYLVEDLCQQERAALAREPKSNKESAKELEEYFRDNGMRWDARVFVDSLADMTSQHHIEEKWQQYQESGLFVNFVSRCGGAIGLLEFLNVAGHSEICSADLFHWAATNFPQGESKKITEVLPQLNPLKQLQLLPVCYELTQYCDDSNDDLFKAIEDTLYSIDEDESSVLLRLVAYSLSRKIEFDLLNNRPNHIEFARDLDIKRFLIHNEKYVNKDSPLYTGEDDEQIKLHKQFPNIALFRSLKRLSPDYVAVLGPTERDIEALIDEDGEQISLQNYASQALSGADRNNVYLLSLIHSPYVKPIIDKELGLDLTNVSLDAQTQLLKYMAEAGDTRFNSLCSILKNINTELGTKFAEGFLAADFGEDFGDALLDIANSKRISNEQLEEVLDQISSCRDSIRNITDLYRDIDDGKFAKEYARAANERLTDAIAVFREIALKGSARANLGWAGEMDFDYDSAMEALKYETKSLEIISGTLTDIRDGKEGVYAERFINPDENHTRSYYNLYSPEHGYVLLYTRPEGAGVFDGMLEYGKYRSRYNENASNAGVEASISFIVDPVNPFVLPNPTRPNWKKLKDPNYYDAPTMDKVSAIRLDREGREVGMASNDERREPIRDKGSVSVDLAAINDRKDTPSGKIARLFSVGNALRLQDSGDTSLNHNTHWFTQDYQTNPQTDETTGGYGTADGFKRIVNYLENNMNALCALHPPKQGEGISAAMRRANRTRGNKALTGFNATSEAA